MISLDHFARCIQVNCVFNAASVEYTIFSTLLENYQRLRHSLEVHRIFL
jgi:hypothetical protein